MDITILSSDGEGDDEGNDFVNLSNSGITIANREIENPVLKVISYIYITPVVITVVGLALVLGIIAVMIAILAIVWIAPLILVSELDKRIE